MWCYFISHLFSVPLYPVQDLFSCWSRSQLLVIVVCYSLHLTLPFVSNYQTLCTSKVQPDKTTKTKDFRAYCRLLTCYISSQVRAPKSQNKKVYSHILAALYFETETRNKKHFLTCLFWHLAIQLSPPVYPLK